MQKQRRLRHTLVSTKELKQPENLVRLFEALKGRKATEQERLELNGQAATLWNSI